MSYSAPFLAEISVPLRAIGWLEESVLDCENNGEDGYQLWYSVFLFNLFLNLSKLKNSLFGAYWAVLSIPHLLCRWRAANLLNHVGGQKICSFNGMAWGTFWDCDGEILWIFTEIWLSYTEAKVGAERVGNSLRNSYQSVCSCQLFLWKLFDPYPKTTFARGSLLQFSNAVSYLVAKTD